MSYCRWSGDSSVYVFCAVQGHLECCGCILNDKWEHYSTDDMLAHLEKHREAGHSVPDYAIERLKEERDENDAFIRESREKVSTEGTQDA